ncbi:carbonate dehydratase [Xylariaceae sp. FL0804]|nr:carbonate dehydratase [Xylariaceae sp. FL0804]
MTSDVQKNLKGKNEAYASQFAHGDLPISPAKKYLIVTCMDARIDPAAAFGIDVGDAHVVRNAGGSVRDAHRSIIVSQQLLGTREVLLIKHTDCGMLTFSNEEAHGVVTEKLGPRAAAEIAGLNFLPFPDLEAAVRDDVDMLKRGATVPDDVPVTGWIYDVKTGRVRQVV